MTRPPATADPSPNAGTPPAGTFSPPRTPRVRRMTNSSLSRAPSGAPAPLSDGRPPFWPPGARAFRPSSSAGSAASTPGGCRPRPSPPSAENASFAGVSCPDGPVCVAVGSSQAHFEFDSLLAERRIGPTWSIQPLPDPPPDTFPPRDFSAVSCLTRRSCHAIGVAAMQTDVGLIAGHFDGGSWRLESFAPGRPLPSALFIPGISCPSRLFCMAVGYWQYKFSGATLAAKWTP